MDIQSRGKGTFVKRIVVEHGLYGCETGCCGHYVILYDGDKEVDSQFDFGHPFNESEELEYAKDLITRQFGEDHVKDLDWENCQIYNYDNDPF